MTKISANKQNIVSFERTADFFLKNGLKKMRAGDFSEAIKYLYSSLSKEDKFETKLGIAQALAQTGRFFESNKFLYQNFKPNERTSSVYFALVCNYALMLEKKQVEIMLSRLNSCAEDEIGFSDETYDAIISSDFSLDFKTCQYIDDDDSEEYIDLALSIARNMLITGNYKRAANVLAKAHSILPDAIEFIPDLLLAYILSGNHTKAAELLNEVDLEKVRTDATFLCVLILLKHFISREDDEEKLNGIKMLASVETDSLDLANYIATTLIYLKKWELAEPFVKKLIKVMPYGKKENHMLALCAFHSGDYAKAKSCYDSILKFDPHDIVAQHFKKICSECLRISQDESLSEKNKEMCLGYIYPDYQLDFRARQEVTAVVREFLELPTEEAGAKLDEEGEFFYELLYVFENYLKLKEQMECLELIYKTGTSNAVKFLEECLLLGDLPFNVKNLAYEKLCELKPNEPLRAAFGNLIVEGDPNPDAYRFYDQTYQKAINICMEKLTAHKKDICRIAAGELFHYYSFHYYNISDSFRADDGMLRAVAAVIGHLAMLRCDLDIELDYVLNMFRVSEERYEKAYELLNDFDFFAYFDDDED
jgi:tetratricopeptide (TPR) repeat protein